MLALRLDGRVTSCTHGSASGRAEKRTGQTCSVIGILLKELQRLFVSPIHPIHLRHLTVLLHVFIALG